ncbi:hypothetical protein H6G16_11910 [Cyanobium sp. FACHB-13342]|nr:hypothetical protein [Cyanobium sp. FACHB-13342]
MSVVAYGFVAGCDYLLAIPPGQAVATMANPDCPRSSPSSDPGSWAWTVEQQRRHLGACWELECDIDPMILRARQLRHLGALPQASCVEQELLPLF